MKTIFIDMDGVLLDFWGRVSELIDHPKIEQKNLGMKDWEFWNLIRPYEESEEFWPKLKKYEWTQDLIQTVKDSGADWYILTSPNLSEYSSKGKVQALHRMFGKHFKDYVITKHKHLLAKPNTLLIDDTEKKVDMFREYGGQAMLFPQIWNRNTHLVHRRVEYYKEAINNFMGD